MDDPIGDVSDIRNQKKRQKGRTGSSFALLRTYQEDKHCLH